MIWSAKEIQSTWKLNVGYSNQEGFLKIILMEG